jgi:cell division transport system permease protein
MAFLFVVVKITQSVARPLFKTSGSSISSFSTVVGITLVLTMIGVLFIFLLVANAITRHFKEQLVVQVMLRDEVSENSVLDLKKRIEGEPYAGGVTFTSKEEAALRYHEELGEDFVEVMGQNPLPASLDITVDPEYPDLGNLENDLIPLQQNSMVREVVYQKSLLQKVNENIAKWGIGLFVIGALFLLIAVVLIVNTIELAIFSQRFIIKSMQLVGATHWFIQKPFLRRGLWFGFMSGLIALALISGILLYFSDELSPVIDILTDQQRFLWVAGAVMGTGLLLSWISTAYAVRRFIRLRQQQLY